ncbi:MAG: hypothetical protein Q8R91_02470 [Candidatus Omnitrophota bacterium]|nr:hypothetical protein [Candidatus Omnitrophota bacterium]
MTAQRKRLLVVATGLLVVVSLWRAVSAERQRVRLAQAYEQARHLLTQLETEHAALQRELVEARQTIEGQAGDLQQAQQELAEAEQHLSHTKADLASLQREHDQVQQQNSSLLARLSSLTVEKQQLEARLSSIRELKLAIRQVNDRLRHERLAAWRAHVETIRQQDQERLTSGNRGYLVRDGRPTLQSPTKLQVRVLEPQPQ